MGGEITAGPARGGGAAVVEVAPGEAALGAAVAAVAAVGVGVALAPLGAAPWSPREQDAESARIGTSAERRFTSG